MASVPLACLVPLREVAAATLAARGASGDDGALREIYAQHGPSVRRFLHGLLQSAAAADDGVQETFVRAFRSLNKLQDGDRLGPWLFGIARNVAREQRKRGRRDAPLEAGPEPIDALCPERALLGREALRAVDDALGTLAEDRRAALLLRVDHGLPYEAIAELMGWSLPKTKVEVHRARQVLRGCIQEGDE